MEKLLQVNELETQFTKDKEKLKILRGSIFISIKERYSGS